MYGYISGITEADYINFCPKCGEEIRRHYRDGTAKCQNEECKFHFGVVECEED